MNPSVL